MRTRAPSVLDKVDRLTQTLEKILLAPDSANLKETLIHIDDTAVELKKLSVQLGKTIKRTDAITEDEIRTFCNKKVSG